MTPITKVGVQKILMSVTGDRIVTVIETGGGTEWGRHATVNCEGHAHSPRYLLTVGLILPPFCSQYVGCYASMRPLQFSRDMSGFQRHRVFCSGLTRMSLFAGLRVMCQRSQHTICFASHDSVSNEGFRKK
jgi:hypothetical protein